MQILMFVHTFFSHELNIPSFENRKFYRVLAAIIGLFRCIRDIRVDPADHKFLILRVTLDCRNIREIATKYSSLSTDIYLCHVQNTKQASAHETNGQYALQ